MSAVAASGEVYAEPEVEAVRVETNPFVVATENTRMPMIFMDALAAGRPIIFANQSFLKLTCYEPAELMEVGFFDLLAAGAMNAQSAAIIEAVFEGTCQEDPELDFRRKDGSIFPASLYVSPVINENGIVGRYFASLVDLTRHKQERDRLNFLLDELNHRTQNLLATIQMLAAQTLRQIADRDVAAALQDRILALSGAYSLLGRHGSERLDVRDVVTETLRPFGAGAQERFRYAGEAVRVPPRVVLSLSLALHELATNARRFGALSAEGVVHIDWHLDSTDEAPALVMDWREAGGPPVSQPVRRGFGTRLIEKGLAMDAGGATRLEFAPEGVQCRIVLKLSSSPGLFASV